jgi:hypothetical protein
MEMTNNNFYDNFYSFNDSYSTKNYRGKLELDFKDWVKVLRCEINTEQLDIRHLEGGKSPNTFFWNGVLSPFCINQDLKEIFEENNITGVNYIPAIVKNKTGDIINEKYYAVCINGRIDAIDYFRSEIIFEESPSGMIVPKFKGLYFNESSWDGTDFIMERPDKFGHFTARIYVSKKVKNLFANNNISFVKFKPFEECTTNAGNIIRDSDDFMQKIRHKIKKATPKKWLIQKALDKKLKKNTIKWDLL